MNFASDNTAGAHPAVLRALVDCNDGAMAAYGGDAVSLRAEAAIREVLDAPQAVVRFVATGTAANALVCAQLSPGYGRIYCHDSAHIHRDECGAPEFFSHGAKLVPLTGAAGRIAPQALAEAIAFGAAGSLNDGANALVSITNATEWGTVYAPDEVAALADVTHAAGLALHMDGARFANAVAGLGCAPADLLRGVDALSFGGTKNGALAAEAVVIVDPARAQGLAQRFAVVDWDVHHGNGTEAIFLDDPDVLTISIHQDRNYPLDTGEAELRGAEGANINIPLPPGCGDASYVEAFERIVLPALARHEPEIVIVACGFDASALDPLGRMLVSAAGFARLTAMVQEAAEDLCEGRLVMVHEGGYSEAYVPFCGHAVIAQLAGSGITAADPLAEVIAARQPEARWRNEVSTYLAELAELFEV